MFKLSDQRTAYFDVDETLVMWDTENARAIDLVWIAPAPDSLVGGLKVARNEKHIDILKQLKQIGWNIVVWSQGGSDHAERAIEALGIEEYVDAILPKPELIVDDKEWEEQYIKRMYLT